MAMNYDNRYRFFLGEAAVICWLDCDDFNCNLTKHVDILAPSLKDTVTRTFTIDPRVVRRLPL